MDLVDEALQEFMGVVMLVIIEKGISCSEPGDESSVVHDSTVALGRRHAFEEVMQFVDQVVLLLVERLPLEHLLAEDFAVVEDLDRRVGVANVGILDSQKQSNANFLAVTYIFEAEELLALWKLAEVLVDVHPLLHVLGVFLLALRQTLHPEVLVLLLLPGEIRYGLSAFPYELHFSLRSSGAASSRPKTKGLADSAKHSLGTAVRIILFVTVLHLPRKRILLVHSRDLRKRPRLMF